MSAPWSLRITGQMMRQLDAHLFPGDNDEHGAVIGASVVTTARGTRLLGRRLFLAQDGVDYLPGDNAYRMLTAAFVRDCALQCANEKLGYLAVHCHRGHDEVRFSDTDLASHERGYPALLDIVNGPPVGALVFAHDAVTGEIWLDDGRRVTLDRAEVLDRPIRRLYPSPPARPPQADERYDRQARLFGDRGQALLAAQRVAVIGAGGAGSLLIEYLAHLGVGELVVVDPDRLEPSNLSRVVGARRSDLHPLLTKPWMPRPIRKFGKRHRSRKVDVARRVAQQAHPKIKFVGLASDVTVAHTAEELVDCDYLFLAADSMQARLLVNALVHQYLIPGVQVGAKVQIEPESGAVLDLFSVIRPLVPGQSCLWCNELVSAAKLQEEATSPEQRQQQRYVDEVEVAEPSVITLNAVAAAHAANDYLLTVTGLLVPTPLYWTKVRPRDGEVVSEIPRRDENCAVCSDARGNLGAGRLRPLPVRLPES
jgi:molybdopterin/thiamine biosynthesis adenylyltransferase